MFQPKLPRSQDLTSFDYYLWVYVKDRVYVSPLPVDIIEQQISNALATFDRA